jgi:hypothetical protein
MSKRLSATDSLPVTKADLKMAKEHNKITIKIEKKKVADHLKAYKRTSNPQSKAYNLEHAKGHKKDLKARQKYAKKVAKLRAKTNG